MRHCFINTSAFSDDALFCQTRAYKVKARKGKAALLIMPTCPMSLRQHTHRSAVASSHTWTDHECCSGQTKGISQACMRVRKPAGCHHLCSCAGCSKAGLLMTHGTAFQHALLTCPPASASLQQVPFHPQNSSKQGEAFLWLGLAHTWKPPTLQLSSFGTRSYPWVLP